MLGRRASLVGALVGAMGVGSRASHSHSVNLLERYPELRQADMPGLDPAATHRAREYKRRCDLWDKECSYMTRRVRRAQIKEGLLGGMPVEAATLGAAKPWFRAQMAARIIEQREWDEKGWFEKKRAEIMGDF